MAATCYESRIYRLFRRLRFAFCSLKINSNLNPKSYHNAKHIKKKHKNHGCNEESFLCENGQNSQFHRETLTCHAK
ncbi:hypothetical protein POPTR_018G110450v4 [Populus trichocarpa]|uniref:Uncharacterized protein n=1 Tax=Populus trichocarpa TaxID=3694 RepID=A0ACC0RPL6_POPTR|nr:hypothetical protein POPTR_018G110450v4 [Populus trichocarpa]